MERQEAGLMDLLHGIPGDIIMRHLEKDMHGMSCRSDVNNARLACKEFRKVIDNNLPVPWPRELELSMRYTKQGRWKEGQFTSTASFKTCLETLDSLDSAEITMKINFELGITPASLVVLPFYGMELSVRQRIRRLAISGYLTKGFDKVFVRFAALLPRIQFLDLSNAYLLDETEKRREMYGALANLAYLEQLRLRRTCDMEGARILEDKVNFKEVEVA